MDFSIAPWNQEDSRATSTDSEENDANLEFCIQINYQLDKDILDMQDLNKCNSHAPFLRKLLEDGVFQNVGANQEIGTHGRLHHVFKILTASLYQD